MDSTRSCSPYEHESFRIEREREHLVLKGLPVSFTRLKLLKSSYEFGMEMLGNDGLLFPRGYELSQPELNFDNDSYGFTDTQSLFLRSRANSIEGGI